ncbi:MAG: DUF309 domain-containing protein, partial [Gemmatimonadetes bacterium]|nr:DUF309 domain-containing protein [Gemmatimonadota bacterium]NIS00105.1 DUF309 domain-containing protein [Gemmatimonadota bacterium]NIT65694.1 DUF309 domain-containing protein [Gemmatimonadota bacterium]NIU51647.1 DUF309 domain-containing protein [Gemmatimonadota bacterium]NIV22425.1 DUF309 domain-containing protein [Gemmatimonadota bacterium]
MTAGSAASKLPAPLRRFVELFNRGEFWDSHEALEDEWRATGSEFYHGLILYASAFVHVARGNAHGITAQLDKAERALRDYPGGYLGVDVEEIRRHLGQCRRLVDENRDAEDFEELIPIPRLALQCERIRGDEAEL